VVDAFLADASLVLFEGFVEAWMVLSLGSSRMTMLGRNSKRLSRPGAEEYAVMAKRMAQTLRRKSVVNAVAV
jgi:hypothetical protein